MISLQNIALFSGATVLLDQCSFILDGKSGKNIAIVGKNGCGKSTLLKVILGEILPDKGKVSAAHEVVGYLPQQITFPPEYSLVGEYLESLLAESWLAYKIDIALQELELQPEFLLLDLHHLSGGEAVKVALVGLLLSDPTILLFDEPTNNLDQKSIAWLESFMRAFPGTIVFVSHDRALINNVCDTIWEIDHETASIRVYGGNFDMFLSERQKRREQQLQRYEAQYKEIVILEKWLVANEFHSKYRFSDLVLSQKQALENLRKNLVAKPEKDPVINTVYQEVEGKNLVVKVSVEKKVLPEKEILKGVSLAVHAHEKILITGPNGAGKTTLLNIIAGMDHDFVGTRIVAPETKIGYLQQFNHFNTRTTVLDTFLQETFVTESVGRSILANYLFTSDFITSKLISLSQGELRKLQLAIILTNKPTVLLLDEPTNHLDIFSKIVLERFIIEAKIPMVIVSHDRYFIEQIGITTELKI